MALLEQQYDINHRARLMVEEKKVFFYIVVVGLHISMWHSYKLYYIVGLWPPSSAVS